MTQSHQMGEVLKGCIFFLPQVVYVAQLQIDEQYKEGRLVSLAQFPVILPVLSFTVVEAVRCRFKPSTDTEHVDRLDAGGPCFLSSHT